MSRVGEKVYLGDGCYAATFDGYSIVLTTENGISVTNQIILEPETYAALARFREKLLLAARSPASAPESSG